MPLTVVAECLAAPGQEDRLRTALEAMIEPSLDEPGCLAYRPYADPNDGARMVIVEQWTSPGPWRSTSPRPTSTTRAKSSTESSPNQ